MEKDQIVVPVASVLPRKALEYATQVAKAYEKAVCLMPLADDVPVERLLDEARAVCPEVRFDAFADNRWSFFTETIEQEEIAMVVFELSKERPFAKIQPLLTLCRDLRIPYIFVKSDFGEVKFERVLVPVTFLVEDREKGMFADAMGRFLHSEILLMQARDYGSKAQATTRTIGQLLDKHDIAHRAVEARKDSYKVEREAVDRAAEWDAGVVMVTASREYGLDDIIFGPKERHIIKAAKVPVMLLNPRGDLYVLCY